MKISRSASVLLIFLYVSQIFAQDSTPKRIRGRIIGYIWNTQLFVKTDKKEYIILYPRTPDMNPLPQFALQEKRIWDFSVKPIQNCQIPFQIFRWGFPSLECDVGEPEDVQRKPAVSVPLYPFLTLTDSIYQKDFDAIGDDQILRCFAIDLENTKPGFKERLITGVVLGKDNAPIPEFPVSIGFEDNKVRYLFVLTDAKGQFSIPVYEKFSYWIKPGDTTIEGQKQFKAVNIRKNTIIPFLQLKLEYEETGNSTVKSN